LGEVLAMSRGDSELLEGETTGAVIGGFRTAHRTLGFGYREHIYGLALERELLAMGLRVEREVSVMVFYRGEPLARQTFDMVVNDRVIVEIKTGEHLASTARDQLFSYLCSTNIEVGLLLHFGHKPTFRRLFCENRFKLHGSVGGAIRRPDEPKSR
jgi:GxxExxY protein